MGIVRGGQERGRGSLPGTIDRGGGRSAPQSSLWDDPILSMRGGRLPESQGHTMCKEATLDPALILEPSCSERRPRKVK